VISLYGVSERKENPQTRERVLYATHVMFSATPWFQNCADEGTAGDIAEKEKQLCSFQFALENTGNVQCV